MADAVSGVDGPDGMLVIVTYEALSRFALLQENRTSSVWSEHGAVPIVRFNLRSLWIYTYGGPYQLAIFDIMHVALKRFRYWSRLLDMGGMAGCT